MEEGSSSAGAACPDAKATVIMALFSLDVSAGCGGQHSTLLDEYERLAFEDQLNRDIVLRRCYSEPSLVRFVHELPQADAPGAGQGEAPAHERAAGRLFWRLHDVVIRLLQALRPVFHWLRSAWERPRRRRTEQAAAGPTGAAAGLPPLIAAV